MDEVTLTDFVDSMNTRSDEELVEIVTERRSDYRPDALMAAEAEMARRNLKGATLAAVQERIESDRLTLLRKSVEPLEPRWKVALLFVPYVALVPPFSYVRTSLAANGYDTKARQAFEWAWLGVVFQVALVCLWGILTGK